MNAYLFELTDAETEKVYQTRSGLTVKRHIDKGIGHPAIERVLARLDREKGAWFSSGVEDGERYVRGAIGFVNPPIELVSRGPSFTIRALNRRGVCLLPVFHQWLAHEPAMRDLRREGRLLTGTIKERPMVINEEERTKHPSIFNVLRAIQQGFYSEEERFLGLYGAYGYDLIFQFEAIMRRKPRPAHHRDLHLYLPDELFAVDHRSGRAYRLAYEFSFGGTTTEGIERAGSGAPPSLGRRDPGAIPPYRKGSYAELVRQALPAFSQGDLFEVVPSQVLYETCDRPPSRIFRRLSRMNPSPYGFLIHLGDQHLIGASPEMYVRVQGRRVETSPISGTIKRGQNAMEDAENVRRLLNSAKDEAELTMCTDVDRNDKSRICVPGSVRVIGRRQIERYARLFHTVDHIVGELAPDYDALDAFMTHMWAVTVTGAPKLEAMRWLEAHEATPREWYGGAVGCLYFNGDMNTGLTLRTIKLAGGMAEMRVGATLLYASDPEAEEEETLVKVSALVQALKSDGRAADTRQNVDRPGQGKRVLLIDHEDSFVHTLANYLKQTGADVVTVRPQPARQMLADDPSFHLVVLSPGPGKPERFQMQDTISLCLARRLPIFGICLGFQGLAEYFGARLDVLPKPAHGEKSTVYIRERDSLFAGMGKALAVGRYHSLFVPELPPSLLLLAETEDGIPMAFRHRQYPLSAVLFHPESILSAASGGGLRLIANLMKSVPDPAYTR
ncbi:anthranilate synthase component I [Caenibacillus caldisaponilyticus]|uniref:anthranilate synthase component I n=1 Tax=Caenibacillus caldisaponilyticus TaxID=1674942 RepID=UPI0009885AB7|nr:anthranilate synthase component I [Caenibacillus caldisaponilyticus]